MNVMNVSVQLGEGNASSESTTMSHDATLGVRPLSRTNHAKGVSSSLTSHLDSSGLDVSRELSSSGKGRIESHFPTELDDEEELHNENFSGVLRVDGAKRNQAHDQINGGSSVMPEIPNEMPGLSIVTWEEFVVNPSLLHNLFSISKEEFIQFDNSIVNNLFLDSRMEPPILGGPADDGLSWNIFVDSYSQLRHVREVMTSRISVLLVDLIKPNDEGTASCVVAINPMDDHIRRALHLTLSRAMESVFANRCFCLEINLNKDIGNWCRMVLQTDCEVLGGRIVITNGEEPQPFCVVESPARCVLCFPVWLYSRIKNMIFRKRRYDDTVLEFEGANFILCTQSETLRQYSETAQLTNGERLIHKNTRAVTMATQTINTSCTSLKSDLSVEEVDDASDNDVIKRRPGAVSNERGRDLYSFDNPSFKDNEEAITYIPQTDSLDKGHQGIDKSENSIITKATTIRSRRNIRENIEPVGNESQKSKSVNFMQEENELDIVASANSAELGSDCFFRGKDKNIKRSNDSNETKHKDTKNLFKDSEEKVLTPRSAFLARPFTPHIHKTKPKDHKVKPKFDKVTELESPRPEEPFPSHASNDVINDKIVKRQKKISGLLKDLMSTSNGPQNSNSNEQEYDYSNFEHKKFSPTWENMAGNLTPRKAEVPVPVARKVRQTPIKDIQITPRDNPVFPYTSELLDFPNSSREEMNAKLEKYGADLKSSKKKQAKTEDMLFLPRLNLDEIEPDRNCFSDLDVSDSDITDMETDRGGAMSDTEGMMSSRLIPVQRTPRTLSFDSVNRIVNNDKNNENNKSDLDSDLEITDCEVEENKQAKNMNSPRILPGALAAQQLRASSANARSRDYIPPSAQMNRRGGNQNDSRRRYLALNSLRRKAYKLGLQSQVRTQKRPGSAELLSYNTRKQQCGVVTIMSAV